MKRWLSSFTLFELVLIASVAAMGIAVKPIITPLVHLITGPLFIPGGSVGGGIYMMFIVIAVLLIPKDGVATLACIIQAIMAISTGVIGGHGFMSLFTYILPGIIMDIMRFVTRKSQVGAFEAFLIGGFGNLAGTYAANLIFFRLPLIPLALSLTAGLLSGGFGGMLANQMVKPLRILLKEGKI